MRGPHDLGGLPDGPVNQTEHVLEPWEKRVHALMNLLSDPCRNRINLHELRREIEGLGSEEYNRLSYYERWITALSKLLLEKGVFTVDELGRKLAEVKAREA
jgi:hypothetical protein